MKDLIIDSLAAYGVYTFARRYWERNKKRIVKGAVNYITETIREAMADPDNPIAISINVGGKK